MRTGKGQKKEEEDEKILKTERSIRGRGNEDFTFWSFYLASETNSSLYILNDLVLGYRPFRAFVTRPIDGNLNAFTAPWINRQKIHRPTKKGLKLWCLYCWIPKLNDLGGFRWASGLFRWAGGSRVKNWEQNSYPGAPRWHPGGWLHTATEDGWSNL